MTEILLNALYVIFAFFAIPIFIYAIVKSATAAYFKAKREASET